MNHGIGYFFSVAALGGMFLASVTLAQTASPAASASSSLPDQTPAAPAIDFVSGQLTIRAANSSLRSILEDLETRTGTKVEGLNRDERIFGVYGPGNPQDVLAALLDDSGYNVLISGRKADGSPREVVLSARTASAMTAQAGSPRTQASDEDDEGPEPAPVPQPALFAPPPQPQQGSSQANPNQPGNSTQQIRTPQQMLEELQRMRQSTNQQQPPQQ